MASSNPSGERPPSIPQPGRPTRVLTSKPIESTSTADEKSAGGDFQKNFPEAQTGPASISEALKTIKPEDALEVHKTVCGRQGFMTAIGTGAASGILRFVWKGALKLSSL
jgi:acetamidase/formamidase